MNRIELTEQNKNSDGERPFVRLLDRPIAWLEGLVNRLAGSRFNPLYHLGTLAIFLLLVLGVTGIYLTIFYRPGADTAYASVEAISANPFGLLMRTMHRYASDAFMVVAVLHALKLLATGRYWGSRWLAWVSGWVIALLAWSIGVLGFWLVWDQRAQWLTESLIELAKGPVAVTFLTTDITTSTFSTFVIVLFVHVFFPLGFAILLFVHVARLARARVLPPRWVMALSVLALALISLVLPVRSAPPAELNRIVEAVHLDIWYLGFLALVDQWGSLAVWVVGFLLLALLLLLPWLARGRHSGPAYVSDDHCTGCTMCSLDCPYHAIEMLPRQEGDTSGHKRRAFVSPNLCTGCGICVGACATAGIQLQRLPAADVYKEGILSRTQRQAAAGTAPVVIFTCQRQAVTGRLAHLQREQASNTAGDLLTCVLPCTGMVDPAWTRELFASGAREIVFASCPYDDCANREGPQWLSTRLKRRKGLLRPSIHWLEMAPGDNRPLDELLAHLARKTPATEAPTLPEPKEYQKAWPRLGAAVVALALLVILSLPVDLPAGRAAVGQGQFRVLVEHRGIIKTGLDEGSMKLPEHASIDSAQILGGERYPVVIQVWIDGQLTAEESYIPGGWRKEGKISGFKQLNIPSGQHHLEVKLKDDGGEWRALYQAALDIQPSTVYTLIYNQTEDRFIQQ